MSDQKDNEFGFEEEELNEEEFIIDETVPAEEAASASAVDEEAFDVDEEAFDVDEEEFGQAPPNEEVRSKSSMLRILLLVLLLAVAAGGYFFFSGPATEPSPAVKTAKKPIPMPEKQPVKPAPAPQPAVAKQPVAEPPAAATEEAAVAKTPAADALPAARDAAAAPAARDQAAAGADQAPAAADATEPAAAEQPTDATAPAAAEPAGAPQGPYSVQVGAYLLQSNLEAARRQAAETGYPTQVEEARKLTEMVRLRYGVFSPEEAPARLDELRRSVPAAFKITDGDQVSVYAGSYTSLDKARRYADLLFEKGIKLQEQTVEVPIPLYKLKLGPFADRAAAEQAAAAVAAAGLPAQVLKKPAQ